jgi:hypothetical protein
VGSNDLRLSLRDKAEDPLKFIVLSEKNASVPLTELAKPKAKEVSFLRNTSWKKEN